MTESFDSCPMPKSDHDRVLLAHGEGARLSRKLLRERLLPKLGNPTLDKLGDGALLPMLQGQIVVSTDSFVVQPLFFPGGDIGRLAVHGTVNDLAVMGAVPKFLSLAFILEEGLPFSVLDAVLDGIRIALEQCGLRVVTGDTKVVPRGACDGLFINTTGLGILRPDCAWSLTQIQPGDRVLVSGTIADHGMAILTAREQVDAESLLESDCAPVHELTERLIPFGDAVRFSRDPTRGGVSAVFREISEATGLGVVVEEPRVPIRPAVRGACELFGLDPLHVANEGKILAVVAPEASEEVLKSLRLHRLGRDAADIGAMSERYPGEVVCRGILGALRVLDEPSGAPLPRIC
ncbi:MAG: hydrogenase expression/formation protein HypE [Planctomycetota bacterium]